MSPHGHVDRRQFRGVANVTQETSKSHWSHSRRVDGLTLVLMETFRASNL